jgi:large repetitive protein
MKHLTRYLLFLLFSWSGLIWAQAPSVTVLTPNGGEVWSGATTQNITWSSVNISNVVIEYSTNNGSNWINITTWPASAQTYAWVVPGAGPLGSTQCLVRIYDALNTAVVDQSNNNFTIPPSSITLLQPNGGEQWPVGSLQSIVWTHSSILNIDIEYSTNNGTNWTSVATNIPALRGFHNWTIPATVSNNCIVRVKDAVNPLTVNDVSNSTFSIIAALTVDVVKYRGGSFDGFTFCQNAAPAVTVLTPNGGEVWPGATTQNITWSYTNIPNNVLIEVSYNNGSNWTTITTWPASAQTFPWVVSGIGSTTCLVRVSDAQNSTINDVSNANFTIPTATISVVQANGGEQWSVGSLQSIVWNSQSVNNVNIDYSTNNGTSWVSVATNQTAQRGFFNWTIPATVSANCLVRVTDASNPLVTDNSNAVFSIIAALTVDVVKYRGGSFDGFTICANQTPAITVLTPNGGEIWSGATTQNITWSYTNISNNVLIEYSTNNGSNWNTITTWPVTAGTYPWMVPGAGPLGSTQCLVRVSDAQNTLVTDQSNATFTIPGSSVTVVQPNGGEQWQVGSLQSIVWNVQSVLTINIEYSTNNGSNWISIATNFNSSIGFYNWIVPATISSNCIVRVSDFANTTTVNDISNSVFSIIGALTVDVNKYRGGGYDGFTSCYTGCVPPTASMSGTQTICTGSSANLSINFTGSGPYVITYTDGTTPVTQSGITANPFVMSVTPTATTSYSLTALSNTCVSGPISGSALVTLTSGPTATLTGNQTICSGASVTLTVALGGASPWTVVWTDGTTPITQTGITGSLLLLSQTPASSRTYSLVSVSSPSCTGGLVSGTAAIQVNAPPVVALSGGNTICSGNTGTLTFTLSGNSPWDIVWTDGTSNFTQLGVTSNPFLTTVTLSQSITYSPVSVTNVCGSGTVNGNAPFVLNAAPVATLTGTQTICVGGTAVLSVGITGISPWSLSWTDGTTPQTQTGITSSPYFVVVTPSSQTTYSLVSVSSICSGTVSGTAIVTHQSGPTATLSGTQTICGIGTAQLSVALTGSAPWSLTWTNGTTPVTQTGITGSPFLLTVTPTQTTTYSLTAVSTSGCPSGVLSGGAIVSVSSIPTASLSGTQTVCGIGTAQLSVALTGSAPWSLTWTDGTTPVTQTGITGSPFLFTVTPTQTTTYSLTAVSTSGCPSGVLSGGAIVSVSSTPTASLSGTQTVCGVVTAQLSVALTGSAPWSLTWTNGTSPVTQTGITGSPFLITVTPTQTTTYSLTAVSTSGCPSGVLSGGAIVSVFSIPTASLSGTQTVCSGVTANLTISLTGTSPYQIVWTDGTTPQTLTGITGSSYTLSVTPISNSTYTLVSIQNSCTGTVSGQAVVSVLSPPSATLSGTQTLCGSGPASLTISFSGAGPWSVSWTDGTTPAAQNGITSSPFVFTVTPIGVTTYTLISVTNPFCNTGSVNGNAIVNQMPLPTGTISGTQSICFGQSANLSVTLTGTAPWNFTYTDGTNVSTVLATTLNSHIFSVTPSTTRTYSITSVSDACGIGSSMGNAIITVVGLPGATLSGTQTICTGSGANLSTAFTGSGPWNLTWTNGVSPVAVTGITANPYIWSVSPSVQTTYSLTNISNGCTGSVSGTAIVNPIPVPTAILSGTQTVCPIQAAQLSVALTGIQPWTIIWTNGTTPITVTGINTSPYTFSVTSMTSTTYSLTQVGSQGCSPGTVSGNAVVSIQPMPTAALSGAGSICAGQTFQFSVALTGSSPWTFSYTDGTNTNSVINTTTTPYWVSVTPSTTRTYSLVSLNNACGSGTVSGTASVQVTQVVSATLSGSQTICNGNSGNISASLVGNAPWNLTWTDGVNSFPVSGITSSPFVFSVSPTATSTFVVLNVNAGGCVGSAFGSHVVSVIPGPALNVSGGQNVCSGVGVQMNFSMTGNPPWNITFTNGTNTFTQTGLTSSPYIFNFTPSASVTYTPISVSNACGAGSVSGNAIYQVTPLTTASISGSQSICPGGSATLSVNFTGSGPWSFIYSNGFSNTSVSNVTASPWTVTVTPSITTTYSLVSLISSGCAGAISGSAVVSLTPTANAIISGSHTICAGGSATLTVNLSGGGPWNLTWTDGTNFTSQTGISTSPYLFSVSPVNSTTYSLSNLVSQGCTGSVTGSGVVTLQSGPTASISGNQTICIGDSAQVSIQLTGTGPWDISWMQGSSTLTQTGLTNSPWVISVTPSVTTTYKVTSVSAPGCSTGTITGSGQVVVQLAPIPSPAVVQSNQSICSTSSLVVANTPTSGTGVWTVTAGTSTVLNPGNATSSVVSLSQGLNSFIWTVTLGACSSSDQLDIYREIPPAPSNAGPSQVICGSTTTLAGNTPTNNATGTWSIVSGSCIISNPNSLNSTVTNIAPGQTVLRWTISNGVCPSTQDTLTIVSALGVTQANAGADQTICIGSANLNANMANPGQGFWTVVSGSGVVTNSLSNSTQLTGMIVGSTVLAWTLTNAGCISSDTMTINRITAPVANFTYTQAGSQFSFTDLSQNPVSWFWTFGDGNNSNQQNPQHTYQQSGMYTVTLIVANGCGSDTAVYQVNNWGVGSSDLTELKDRIEMYPNPSTGKTTVNIWGTDAEEFDLKVTDILGHTVIVSGKKFSLMDGVKWDLDFSELSAGVYQIEINGAGKSVTRQLMLVR